MLYESDSITVSLDAGVATLSLDFDGTPPNLWNAERFEEFLRAFATFDGNPAVNVLLIRSAKAAGFCAGLDLEFLADFTSPDTREFVRLGQQLSQRIADAPFITVAFLHGLVRSPGLDLALACDYRLAVATPTTLLGFPDLVHGLFPVCGGITRLTRLVGAANAVELLASNDTLTAPEALRIGLVDRAFCERRAKIELRTFLDHVRRKPRGWQTPLDGWAARRVVAAYRDAAKNTTTAAVLKIVPVAAANEAKGLLAERAGFVEMLASAALAMRLDENIPASHWLPQHLVVVGPVDPVADLICESLLRGSRVSVIDPSEDRTSHGLEPLLEVALERGRVTPLEAEQARSCLSFAEHLSDEGAKATAGDLVLLTLDTAQSLEVAEVAGKTGASIVAVNCELPSLVTLSSQPQRLVGLQRVATCEFLEIARLKVTSDTSATRLRSWLAALGRTAIVVRARHGSLVRGLLSAWWDEAVRLVADGLPIHAVDAAARSLGANAGPLETLDGVGLDSVAAEVPRVKPLLAAGIRGRPHNDGFYVLSPDNPTCTNAIAQLVLLEAAAGPQKAPRLIETLDAQASQDLCRERLTARLLVAAIARLEVDPHCQAGEIDLAVVRGLGAFAGAGGILRHADRQGLSVALDSLRTHARRFGKRFLPPALLVRLASENDSFHGCPRSESRLRMSA